MKKGTTHPCIVCKERPKVAYGKGLCASCVDSLEEHRSAHTITGDPLWYIRRSWHYATKAAREKALCALLFGDDRISSEQFCNAEARVAAEALATELAAPRWFWRSPVGLLIASGIVIGEIESKNGGIYAQVCNGSAQYPHPFDHPDKAMRAVELASLGKILLPEALKS